MASVTLTYMKAGTKPPLFLAGSFSAWKPEEMQYEIAEGQEGEYRFHKIIEAEEGKEFQYKFRIGPGDWWVCDENAPKGKESSPPLKQHQTDLVHSHR